MWPFELTKFLSNKRHQMRWQYQSTVIDNSWTVMSGEDRQLAPLIMTKVSKVQNSRQSGRNQGESTDQRFADELSDDTCFWISQSPVTVAQWEAVCGRLPRWKRRKQSYNDSVVLVTWNEAHQFCVILSQLCSTVQNRFAFSIPTKTQWYRAHEHGLLHFGNSLVASSRGGLAEWLSDSYVPEDVVDVAQWVKTYPAIQVINPVDQSTLYYGLDSISSFIGLRVCAIDSPDVHSCSHQGTAHAL